MSKTMRGRLIPKWVTFNYALSLTLPEDGGRRLTGTGRKALEKLMYETHELPFKHDGKHIKVNYQSLKNLLQ